MSDSMLKLLNSEELAKLDRCESASDLERFVKSLKHLTKAQKEQLFDELL